MRIDSQSYRKSLQMFGMVKLRVCLVVSLRPLFRFVVLPIYDFLPAICVARDV